MSRKYFLNENYFNKINNQNKAYYLGFLYADGYIYKNNGGFHLCISEVDIEILKNLQNDLNTNRPIRKILIRNKKRARLDICSKKLALGLIKYGCINKKTFILKYPYLLNKKYSRHFIRGYLDGDGCIHIRTIKKKYISLMVYLTGTKIFLKEIKQITKNKNALIKTKSEGIYRLYFYNGANKFLNWCYKDAKIFLKRKYLIWKNYINNGGLK